VGRVGDASSVVSVSVGLHVVVFVVDVFVEEVLVLRRADGRVVCCLLLFGRGVERRLWRDLVTALAKDASNDDCFCEEGGCFCLVRASKVPVGAGEWCVVVWERRRRRRNSASGRAWGLV